MGWTKGKGLGANLDGNLNFVKITHKDDNKGMGFHERDDQWTQHEQNFNALLKSFETADEEAKKKTDETAAAAADEPIDNANNGEEPLACQGFGFQAPKANRSDPAPPLTKETVVSGLSLEAQSKKSTKRVHYKKFTRGKDLARYSEQDLANIFGKKSLNDQHAFDAAPDAVAAADDSDSDEKAERKEEHVFGVTVIKTGTSIADYFKEKMEALRLKRLQLPSGETSSNPFYMYNPEKVVLDIPQDDDDQQQVTREKPKKSKKKAKSSPDVPEVEDAALDVPKEKRSKKQKSRDSDDPNVESRPKQNEVSLQTEDTEVVTKVKKSKKSKVLDAEQNVDVVDKEEGHESEVVPIPKKTKKTKRSDVAENTAEEPSNGIIDDEACGETKTCKKKKRKHAEFSPKGDDVSSNVPDVADVSVEPTAKKSKKSKNERCAVDADDKSNESITEPAPAKRKNKSKSKAAGFEVTTPSTQPLHFPIFVSTLLTGLYDVDPSIVPDDDDAGGGSVEDASAAAGTSTEDASSLEQQHRPTSNNSILSDTYEMAKYKAEVFRYFDLGAFAGSSLSDLVGYGYDRNLQLRVVSKPSDNRQIADFWDKVLANKYSDAGTVKANKAAYKKKKYSVKGLEKKNVFRRI